MRALSTGMKLLVGVVFACGGCTIDPVARAELSGAATGTAIFQRAGTSSQVSFELTLEGEDGSYAVSLEASACDGAAAERASVGTIELGDGIGVLRGVRDDWDIGGGDTDIIGRFVVARRAFETVTTSCGEIFSSD